LIVTEGERTEDQYFRGLAQYFRATGTTVRSADVQLEGVGKDPGRVVRAALAAKQADPDFDAVWVAFDLDDHTRVSETVATALRAGLRVAITNPCFELWLVWHFRCHARHSDAKELSRILQGYGINGKHMPQVFDYSLHENALMNAIVVVDTVPPNPGSGVPQLVRRIRN